MSQLEQAIYNTIRYFDIFDMPITATQVWQYLIVDDHTETRWSGHRHHQLIEVQDALRDSAWLKVRLGMKWGYYFLEGREDLVRERLQRHSLAQDKWKITRRAARWLALTPFVRALAGSGSLAIDNTKESSDLDLFVIAAEGRVWTARLGLLVVSQLLGRRRKYWNREAPDMICLNHYVTDGHLLITHDIQNIYTAVMYAALVPVYGGGAVREFQQENGGWMRPFIMQPDMVQAEHVYEVVPGRRGLFLKRLLESWLLEPIGDMVERAARRIQQSIIERHRVQGQAGRVALSDFELAFHPDTKMPAILQQFYTDPGQQHLL